MPANTVKVDRSTRWGNPYSVTDQGRAWSIAAGWHDRWEVRHREHVRGDVYPARDEAVGWAVMRFACEIAPLWDTTDLRGKNLACWCALDAPCHADVLLEIANQEDR